MVLFVSAQDSRWDLHTQICFALLLQHKIFLCKIRYRSRHRARLNCVNIDMNDFGCWGCQGLCEHNLNNTRAKFASYYLIADLSCVTVYITDRLCIDCCPQRPPDPRQPAARRCRSSPPHPAIAHLHRRRHHRRQRRSRRLRRPRRPVRRPARRRRCARLCHRRCRRHHRRVFARRPAPRLRLSARRPSTLVAPASCGSGLE